MEDNSIVKGESNIPEAHKKIMQLCCEPANCRPAPDVIDAIHSADLIILGPGSLFTSVIPNLLLPDFADKLKESDVPKIYICNFISCWK